MADNFQKIDKEYLFTDSTVNSYGFRLLTSGYLLPEFEKNPIGYYMHQRDDGVVVRWTDFRIDGDQVFAKPIINLSNPRGQQTVDEIEGGFLNAASVGHYVILEISDDDALKVPGQTGPTITKWYNRELSLVDIPGNYNALAELYDVDGNHIQNLADYSKITTRNMNKIFTAANLAALNLKEDADQTAVDVAFNALVDKANKSEGLNLQIKALTDQNTALSTQISDLQAKGVTEKVASILEKALADKKITVALKDQLAKDYVTNPDGLAALVGAMSPIVSISTEIGKSEGSNSRLAQLAAKSWNELDRAGQLPELKALSDEAFKKKFKETFGNEWTKA